MECSIRERLLIAEDSLLNAMANDPKSLELVCSSWEDLVHDIQQAIHAKALDHDTIDLAFATTSRIAIVSESILETNTDEISATLKRELDCIFSKLSLTDIASSPLSSHRNPPVVASHTIPISQDVIQQDSSYSSATSARYIAPASKWLLKNLHDPYPSNDVKQSIADSAGVDVRHINAWFKNARRRIHWTTISRTHFSGSRSETVDAAYRVFVAEDPDRPLEPGIISPFMEMMVTAETIYSDKLRRDAQLDVALEGPTNGVRAMGAHSCNVGQRPAQMEAAAGDPTSLGNPPPATPESSYPSPLQSLISTPEPHLSTARREDTECDKNLMAGRKRRISINSSEPDDVLDCDDNRANKRFRFAAYC